MAVVVVLSLFSLQVDSFLDGIVGFASLDFERPLSSSLLSLLLLLMLVFVAVVLLLLLLSWSSSSLLMSFNFYQVEKAN